MAIIEVHGLVKRYGDHTAVNGVGFAVEQGEIFGFVTEVALAIPGCPSRLQFAQAGSTGCAAL
jgi:ABC-type phosphonate transport system ATPase subunit